MTFSAPTPLTEVHDSSAFDCGIAALDQWLRRRALANQASGGSRTYVVCRDRNVVVGYHALAAGSVAHADAPGRIKRNMPDPVPMMMLGRLAVDRSAQGHGVGHGLLKDAVQRVVQAADIVGVRGILVDAVDEAACSFYERFGFRRTAAFKLKLMITLDEARHAISGGGGSTA